MVLLPQRVMVSVRVLIMFHQLLTVSCGTEKQLQLKNYETLSYVHVSSIVKRSSSHTKDVKLKTLRFKAFKRDFHLTVTPGTSVLAPNFKASLVHKNGSMTMFQINQNNHFTGHDTYNSKSKVHAFIEEDSLWTIQIIEEDDVYIVEPAWRLLNQSENPRNETMVIYRLSELQDVAVPSSNQAPYSISGSLFGPGMLNENLKRHLKFQADGKRPNRWKRAPPKGLKSPTCLMFLVGDTEFFNKKCNRNHASCSSLMIMYLGFVDRIFRKSEFDYPYDDDVFKNVGLQVAKLYIYEDYTNPPSKGRHFNEKDANWTVLDKLDKFAIHMRDMYAEYCLNHLFTSISDRKSHVGAAYPGTICWRSQMGSNDRRMVNTGISTTENEYTQPLPHLEIVIILLHELGHNFGAYHDPNTTECGPGLDGAYVMGGPHDVNDKNNFLFSPCSRRSIGRALFCCGQCLVERRSRNYWCGNGIVDPGEDCDSGPNFCCNDECKFRPWSECSDEDQECCHMCKISPANTVCNETLKVESCIDHSYCSGNDTVCMDSDYLPDGAECAERHECLGGKCTGPCEIASHKQGRKLEPCLCTSSEESCQWCCRAHFLEACKPLPPPETKPNGTACYNGICIDGVCEPSSIDEEIPDVKIPWYKRNPWRKNITKYKKKPPSLTFLQENAIVVMAVLCVLTWVPAVTYFSWKDCKTKFPDAGKQAVKSENLPGDNAPSNDLTKDSSHNTTDEQNKNKINTAGTDVDTGLA